MNLHVLFAQANAAKKLAKLPKSKLEHLLQLVKIELTNYNVATKNYPKDRDEKYGEPFRANLQNQIDLLNDALSKK